jgi:hypothetical protein
MKLLYIDQKATCANLYVKLLPKGIALPEFEKNSMKLLEKIVLLFMKVIERLSSGQYFA